MKRVYLIGFRGTGFRNERYKDESLLIRAGHVGFYFEDEPDRIFGFHPTEQAANAVGDDVDVINWLKHHRVLEGALHNDSATFHRAYELAQSDAPTDVWQMAMPLEDNRYDQIREQAQQWYNDNRAFMYSFPPAESKADRDNCATFPRKLGLPLPESTGNLREYIPALQTNGKLWSPEGD
jgi:hypothetical protein